MLQISNWEGKKKKGAPTHELHLQNLIRSLQPTGHSPEPRQGAFPKAKGNGTNKNGAAACGSRQVATMLCTVVKELVKKPEGRTFLLQDTNWQPKASADRWWEQRGIRAVWCLGSTAVGAGKTGDLALAWDPQDCRMLAWATEDPTCRLPLCPQQRYRGLWLHPSNRNPHYSSLSGDVGASAESIRLSFPMRSRFPWGTVTLSPWRHPSSPGISAVRQAIAFALWVAMQPKNWALLRGNQTEGL